MPRVPRKEQKRKVICESCRRRKQKCTLPEDVAPSTTPLPEAHRCKGCQQRDVECVFVQDDCQKTAAAAQSTMTALHSASAALVLAVRNQQPATTQAVKTTGPAASHEALQLAQQVIQKRQTYHSCSLVTGMCAMLLREERFASRLAPRSGGDFYFDALVGLLDPEEIKEKLEPARLFYPPLQSYTALLRVWRKNPSNLEHRMLLATLLWLALPHLDDDDVPKLSHYMLRGDIRECGGKLLAYRAKSIDHTASQAFDLLFYYSPLALDHQRTPPKRSHGKPSFFGRQLLFDAVEWGSRVSNYTIFPRSYWHALLLPETKDDMIPTGRGFPSSGRPFARLGTVALQHRLELLSVVRSYERKIEAWSSVMGASGPTVPQVNALQALLESYNAAMAHARQALVREFAEPSMSFPELEDEVQAKRCLINHFEHLTLIFGLNAASYIRAVSFRMTVGPLDKAAVEATLAQPGSPLARLASHIARFMSDSVSQSLANSVDDCQEYAWAVPATERAIFLCATVKHAMESLAGYIYFEREKPRRLDETITLLVAVARDSNYYVNRVEDPFAPKPELGKTEAAIEKGDVYIAAADVASKASWALARWREYLYEESWSHDRARLNLPMIDDDELMKASGLLCDDESGLEGKDPTYQHEQRKERLLAQMWAASRGKED